MLIVNMGTGTFSSLRRLLLAMVIGLVTLGRMDRSPLQRGYETWDRGLQSYIGMLLVDYTHNHPVMRVFCKILTDHVHPPDTSCDELHDVVVSSLHREGPSNRPGKINFARKRWYLVYMLIKNPTLVQHRKGRLTRAPDVDAIEIEIPDKCSMSKYRQQVRDWICSKRSSTDPDADIQPYLSG